jgi:aminoglycoside 6'-N-acetyltransferase I
MELVVTPNGRDSGHLFAYHLAHGFVDEGRRLIGRPL